MSSATQGDRAGLERRERRPLVRWDELLATAAGAALATLMLSRLGVAGTIIGAACTPVIITVTSAALSRQIDQARRRALALRTGRPMPPPRKLLAHLPRGRRLVAALITAALAFAIVAALITISEAATGKPVSDWGHRGGTGYTFTGGGGTSASHTVTGVGSTTTAPSSPTSTSSHTSTSRTTPASHQTTTRPGARTQTRQQATSTSTATQTGASHVTTTTPSAPGARSTSTTPSP